MINFVWSFHLLKEVLFGSKTYTLIHNTLHIRMESVRLFLSNTDYHIITHEQAFLMSEF